MERVFLEVKRREKGLPTQAKGNMQDKEVREYRLCLGRTESPGFGGARCVWKGIVGDGSEREARVRG